MGHDTTKPQSSLQFPLGGRFPGGGIRMSKQLCRRSSVTPPMWEEMNSGIFRISKCDSNSIRGKSGSHLGMSVQAMEHLGAPLLRMKLRRRYHEVKLPVRDAHAGGGSPWTGQSGTSRRHRKRPSPLATGGCGGRRFRYRLRCLQPALPPQNPFSA